MRGRWPPKLLGVALALTAVACSGGSNPGSSAAEVNATLTDEGIILDVNSVPAGAVAFTVSNQGTVVHEFEVIEGEHTGLPISRGVADLSSVVIVDEVEDVVPGVSIDLDVDLEPGLYTLLCNHPDHYAMGMVATLTVTG